MGNKARRPVYYERGNLRFHTISTEELVSDPQFQSGYRDRLAGLQPKPLYFDDGVGDRRDSWGYERGLLVACWLLATGQKPPRPDDILRLMRAYRGAEDADAVL